MLGVLFEMAIVGVAPVLVAHVLDAASKGQQGDERQHQQAGGQAGLDAQTLELARELARQNLGMNLIDEKH